MPLHSSDWQLSLRLGAAQFRANISHKDKYPAVAKVKLRSARVLMEIWTGEQRWNLLWRMQIHSIDKTMRVFQMRAVEEQGSGCPAYSTPDLYLYNSCEFVPGNHGSIFFLHGPVFWFSNQPLWLWLTLWRHFLRVTLTSSPHSWSPVGKSQRGGAP